METAAGGRDRYEQERRWEEADGRVAQALRECEGEAEAPKGDLAEAAVLKCLNANRANTLALVTCLRACDAPAGKERPYREVEAEVADDAAMGLTMQSPHTLIGMLVRAGGIERIAVNEKVPVDGAGAAVDEAVCAPAADTPAPEPTAETDGSAACRATGEAVVGICEEGDADPVVDAAPVSDAIAPAGQPVDYTLRTTDAGRAALAAFDPVVRFGKLVASEPEGYLDAYARVLDACAAPEGASRAAVEGALAGHPALGTPKRIYPGYFISKLETVGALSWDGAWHATAAGEDMLAAFA